MKYGSVGEGGAYHPGVMFGEYTDMCEESFEWFGGCRPMLMDTSHS